MSRRGRDSDVPGEGHETDTEPALDSTEERRRGRLGGAEPRRGDVRREHRAGRVDHEHDGRVLDRRAALDVRALPFRR